MNPLEALLLFLSLTWMVADRERLVSRRPVGSHPGGDDAALHPEHGLRQARRAEQRLRQLTDQAVLAMVAELRRQLRNDW
ncbi:MAG TPA: hypothetical protein VK988_09700 [Acidimicrobiales bacterium]|nr:hypothetical protein [Acidimicrobiales bacterium]